MLAGADYLSYLGRSLSVAERTALQCSLPLLAHRCSARVTATQWWGKVCGYRGDYHIACIRSSRSSHCVGDSKDAETADLFGEAAYFYSTDGGNTWGVLPEVTATQAEACERLRGVFRGVPTYEYRLRDVIPPPPYREQQHEQHEQHDDGAAAAGAVTGDEATDAAAAATTSPLLRLPPVDPLLVEAAAAVRATAATARRHGGASAAARSDDAGKDDNGGDDDSNEDDDDEEDDDGDEEAEEAAAAARAAELRRLRKAAMQPKTILVSVREVVRLSHFVRLHDGACRLVVRGEYLRPRGVRHEELHSNNDGDGKDTMDTARCATCGVRNRNFAGQPLQNALRPSCYLKAASYGDATRSSILYGPTYNAHTDYLSPITDDVPAGVWTVKYDAAHNVVTVRNLWFDGALFCYRPGTTERCQVYYGDGQRVLDVCFML